MERIKNFFKDESGASAVEYGLLVAVIAVGLVAVLVPLRTAIDGAIGRATTELGTAGVD